MKRFIKVFALAVGLLTAFTPAFATTRYVSPTGYGQYANMSSAYSAAAIGDTILVGPGTYTDNLNITKRLVWIGAGWDQTTLTNSPTFGSGSNGTVWEGFRVSGTYLNFIGTADSISIRCCYLSDNGSLILANSSACRLFVEDCILIESSTSGIVVNLPTASTLWRNCVFAITTTSSSAFLNGASTTGTTELYNCVFLNVRTVFNLPAGAQPVIAINNVFYDWGTTPTFGTYPATSIFDYNASTSAIAAPGTNAIALGTTDPFVNYDEAANYVHGTSDLHLAGGSPLIDAGIPAWNDFPDGSRSDCGIYGGPRPLVDNGVPNYPWVLNMVVTPNLIGQGTPVNGTATGRVGPQY